MVRSGTRDLRRFIYIRLHCHISIVIPAVKDPLTALFFIFISKPDEWHCRTLAVDTKGGLKIPGTESKQVTPEEEEPENIDSQALRDHPLTKPGNQDDDWRHVQKT